MSGVFPFGPLPFNDDNRPKVGNAAHAIGIVKFGGKTVATDVTGVFTLWRDGTLIVNQRQMIQDVDAEHGSGTLRCTIAPQELSAPGTYQWSMMFTATVNGDTAIATHYGDFEL